MSLALQIPQEYGYVLAVASSSFLVNYVHFYLTVKYRKASGVQYPAAYASEEQAAKDPMAARFNCAQRAHANFIENQTSFLGGLAITSLRYPMPAAIMGATWVFGRIAYAFGYTSAAGPKGRGFGFLVSALADLGLRFTATYASVMYALGN